ncbi:MAG: phospho-sugar mutase [Clostridia bacterium]|nr:phospho-sugar mutase [Clostridia bacterium]
MQWNEWYNNVTSKERKLMDEMTQTEKANAFEGNLEFGTAGMRGIMGLGPNRMNNYTVAHVTQAFAQILKEQNAKSIAISYDTRFNSCDFAKLAACICAKHGIKVFLADCMPTPFLSFMVRYYHCDGGIMITASHNSKEWNGYKAYDSTGCQILPKLAEKIVKKINDINKFNIDITNFEELQKNGLIMSTDDNCLNAFLSSIKQQSRGDINNLTVVYSALNGTGINVVPNLLHKRGVNTIKNEEQCTIDPSFGTCPSPNPEKPEVYTYSRQLGLKNNADLILCTDPDSDRLGVEVLHDKEYVHLTGNEIGILLCDYLLSHSPKGGYIMRSIVSTNLVDKIAQKYGAKLKIVLTGFKYIGEFLNTLEQQKREQEFIFGFEESCSFLAGSYIREKDGAVAAMLVCELASLCKQQGKTLVNKLNEIYQEFGYCKHKVLSYKFDGANQSKILNIMSNLRANPIKELGGQKVVQITDYKDGFNDIPKANMLKYDLEKNAVAIFRPSGTEPLLKIYLTTYQNNLKDNIEQKIIDNLDKMFKI